MSSCIFSSLVHSLDSDVVHSKSNSSDLDIVKIEVEMLLHDHDNRSDLSYSEDDLVAHTFIFGYQRCQSKPADSQNIK